MYVNGKKINRKVSSASRLNSFMNNFRLLSYSWRIKYMFNMIVNMIKLTDISSDLFYLKMIGDHALPVEETLTLSMAGDSFSATYIYR